MKLKIDIVDGYEAPTEPLKTDADYVAFVMNIAAQSYAQQYGVGTVEKGIAAAREAFNAALAPKEG